MEQYERARERVCNACSSELFQKCNTKCENFFYKLGYYTAIYAPIILVTSIIVFLALGFGIWEGNSKSELYYLWIPSGSRLLGEREYTDIHHGGYASRTEYLMANPKGNVQEMMKVPVQDQVFSMFNASMHNITVRDRSLSYPVGFYQLCSRVPTPAALLGILRLTGGLGLPCTIYSGTDCYQEGSFANDIPPAAVAITAAAGSSTLTSKYASEPSYKNLTSEQMWSKMGGYWGGTYTGQSCTNWARVPIPENFMFGGVDRMPLPSHNVTRVGSLQMVMQLKTPEQFAKWKCVEDCSARKSCALTTGACVDPNFDPTGAKTGVVPGSCQSNITSVYTPQCFAACSQSPDPNVTAPFMKCVGVDVCYNSNATACNVPQNPLAQLCNACATTANLSLAVPPCSTCVQACGLSTPAFVNCVKACVTPKVVGCATACAAAGSMCEISCQNECAHSVNSSDVAEAEDTIMRWEQSFLDFMERQENSSNYLFEVNYFAERSTDDLTSLAGDADAKLIIAGYIAMIVFGCLTLVRPCDPLQSKFMLGFGGMLLIIISIIGTLGFSALVGIVYVPTIIQVMPFLALGMGTYDMFSLAFGFQYYPQRSIPDMIGELLRDAGPRLTLASASNIVAFGIGTNIPITAVYWLAAAMCIMMLFSWIILIFGFTALIALHAERIRKNQVDTLCCFTTSKRSSEIRVEREEQLGWLSQKVTDFVFWWPVKIFLFIGTIIIFAVAMWGATQLRIGLPLSDIVPEDHYSYGFLKARDQSYGSFNSYIITGYVAGKSYDLDYSDYNVLASLMRMERQMEKVSGSDANAPIWQTSWIENFLRWCRRNSTGCAENQNANHPTDIILLENTATGVVNYTTGFWPLKSRFQISLAEFLGAQEGLNYAQYLEQNVTTGVIISSRILFVQRGLDNDELVIDYIVASRKVTDACTVACFPQGLLYNLYEQYVDTQHYLTTNLGYTVIGVVLICCFFLLHPGAVLIMVGIIVLTIAEVYGYLALFDLKLNGVSVVNLILAIGIVVAPVAHITRVFMVTEGSNQERAKFALARMVSPMLWSTISTFIGELPMQFARFPYFRLYFFHMYVLIGLLTLFNSFIVLPYGLEYFGPPPVRERENNNKSTSPEGVDLALPGLEDASGE